MRGRRNDHPRARRELFDEDVTLSTRLLSATRVGNRLFRDDDDDRRMQYYWSGLENYFEFPNASFFHESRIM